MQVSSLPKCENPFLMFSFSVKVCEKQLIIKEKKQEYIKREKSALHLLNNTPGIISLACTFQDRDKLYFVLTFAANGELLKYIRHRSVSIECAKFYSGKSLGFTETFFIEFFTIPAELLLVIEEMHKKNIIHR